MLSTQDFLSVPCRLLAIISLVKKCNCKEFQRNINYSVVICYLLRKKILNEVRGVNKTT